MTLTTSVFLKKTIIRIVLFTLLKLNRLFCNKSLTLLSQILLSYKFLIFSNDQFNTSCQTSSGSQSLNTIERAVEVLNSATLSR